MKGIYTLALCMGLAIASEESSTGLAPASELVHDCFGFPETNFNAKNNIKGTYGSSPHTSGGRAIGDSAVDFTGYDVNGHEYTLSKLLAEKPVALVWGMYTCPAFRGLKGDYPFDQCSYEEEWETVEAYKDKVTFVHLYGPEPHPVSPDTNFDSGRQAMNYWSTVRQPRDWDSRLTMAKKITNLMHPEALLIADLFKGNPHDAAANQPIWCTLGLGARPAILIGQDGKVKFQQDWFRKDDFAQAIESLDA